MPLRACSTYFVCPEVHIEFARLTVERGLVSSITSNVPPSLIHRHSWNDVAWWAVHPGGTVVLAQVAKELELSDKVLRFSYHVFENFGTMSSPSVLFVLREVLDRGRPQPGQRGMLLVIGAGPVGLFLANLLGRAGTKNLLLEKRRAETAPSMPIGIMPPSLKLFESIALAAPLVRAGCAVRSAVLHDQTSTLGCLDLTTLPAPFPFILSLPQGELMRILRERLVDCSWVRFMEGCEAIGVRQNSSSATVQVRCS